MKKLHKLMLFAMLLFVATACDDKVNENDGYLTLSYANIAGTWKLSSWNGIEQTDADPYVYMILERREEDFGYRKFTIYQNIKSDKSELKTGLYQIYIDEDDDQVVKGMYDHASGLWSNEYYIREITQNQMKWVSYKDGSDVSIYKRVTEVPKDIVDRTKSL